MEGSQEDPKLEAKEENLPEKRTLSSDGSRESNVVKHPGKPAHQTH